MKKNCHFFTWEISAKSLYLLNSFYNFCEIFDFLFARTSLSKNFTNCQISTPKPKNWGNFQMNPQFFVVNFKIFENHCKNFFYLSNFVLKKLFLFHLLLPLHVYKMNKIYQFAKNWWNLKTTILLIPVKKCSNIFYSHKFSPAILFSPFTVIEWKMLWLFILCKLKGWCCADRWSIKSVFFIGIYGAMW